MRWDDFIVDGMVEVYRVLWSSPLRFVFLYILLKSLKGRLAWSERLCMLSKVDCVGGCGRHTVGW